MTNRTFKVTPVEPGQQLWYIVRGTGFHLTTYRGDIIVPVTAVEVTDIYTHPDPTRNAVWRHRRADGTDYIDVPTGEKNEQGWDVWEKKEISWLNGAPSVNQFVWIDEPVGHAIQVGDYHGGLYLTLHEAQRNAIPSKKKHLKRRLQYSRTRHQRFIASTWKTSGESHPGFYSYPDKKIYVRKK